MRGFVSNIIMLGLVGSLGVETVRAQGGTAQWSGRSNGDTVFRRTDDVSLRRSGLAGFSLEFTGDAKKLGTMSTGFFDFYQNRTTPLLQALFSRDSTRQTFDWSVTRQRLPRQSFCFTCTYNVRGSVAKGSHTRWIPLYLAPGSGYPVLQGFRIQVVGQPRRVNALAVEIIETSYYFPRFHLKVHLSGDRAFAFNYEVQVTTAMDALVRDTGSVTFLGRGHGFSRYRYNETLDHPALQGFNFRFASGTHRLDRIAVELTPEGVTTSFADGGYDDLYHATIRWIDFVDN